MNFVAHCTCTCKPDQLNIQIKFCPVARFSISYFWSEKWKNRHFFVFGVVMKNKKQNNLSIFYYLIFDWQLKMERTNDTLITDSCTSIRSTSQLPILTSPLHQNRALNYSPTAILHLGARCTRYKNYTAQNAFSFLDVKAPQLSEWFLAVLKRSLTQSFPGLIRDESFCTDKSVVYVTTFWILTCSSWKMPRKFEGESACVKMAWLQI